MIRVEFYGVVRAHAGRESLEIEADTLGSLLERLAEALPQLASYCISGTRLQPGYLANVNGETFTNAPETPLRKGDSVLILSADMGG